MPNLFKSYPIFLLLAMFLIGCNFVATSDGTDDENETEELTAFRELLNEKFEEQKLPYEGFVAFDEYDPNEFLSQDDFEMLELYMVAVEGFSENRYVAKDWVELESGVRLVTIYYKDDDGAVSTWAVTYSDEDWYVDNERIGMDFGDEGIIQMTMSSVVTNDKIERTNTIVLEDEDDIIETEIFYIQADGQIYSENELEL